MPDQTAARPAAEDLKPGQWVVHQSGSVHQLKRRKSDGDGWWLCDGGGLADRVLDGPDWLPIGSWLFDQEANDA